MGRIADIETIAAHVTRARARDKTVALANGGFDLMHVGHVRYLRDAAKLADLLIVAVNSDASVRRQKGEGRPVYPEAERAEMVAALDGIDWVVVFAEDTVAHIIARLQPDVHVKGTDYSPDTVPEAQAVRAYGGRVAIAGDPKDHSSSELIARLRRRE